MVTFINIDPPKNMRRFYSVQIMLTLFGGWCIMREYGRIGSPGRVTLESFDSQQDAQHAEQQTIRLRSRHGYSQVSA